jgi:hypothetical protein
MTQDATAHDRDDCLVGECSHPDHYLQDAEVDLQYFLALVAGAPRDHVMPECAYSSRFPVML